MGPLGIGFTGLGCINWCNGVMGQWCVYSDPVVEKLGKSVGIMTLLYVI